MKAILGKFMEIQKDQNDLLREIAGKDALLQFWKNSVELNMHRRDYHGCFWDSSIAVYEQQQLYRELEILSLQFKQNHGRLEELRKQLFAEVF